MLDFLKKLLWDASAFERYARAGLLAAAVALTTARDGGGIDWLAFGAAFVGGLIGAGDKTLATLSTSSDRDIQRDGVATRPIADTKQP